VPNVLSRVSSATITPSIASSATSRPVSTCSLRAVLQRLTRPAVAAFFAPPPPPPPTKGSLSAPILSAMLLSLKR
jgi:hypothetical protein